ncbi:hypothetical protein [Halorarius litoreus]|uniref:hypothetical protein n=1 Tax=Halorarius litoreus TaxID=2962676 RepID=UPI0020CDE391|nr:hypothetical protein [Halorarius litoreus]
MDRSDDLGPSDSPVRRPDEATSDKTTEEPRPRRPSRRAVLGSLGTVALAGVAGCSSTGSSADASEPTRGAATPANPTATSQQTETPTEETPTAQASRKYLDIARSELDAAFTEIYSVRLVNYEEKVWTPRFEDLGNMDPTVVDRHLKTARAALANVEAEEGTELAVRAELLRHVASIADYGSTFYRRFALTFEKIYQYEYLIDTKSDYDGAVERMGAAREKLATWRTLGEKLTEEVKAVKQLYDTHDSVAAQVPAFDIGRWNYTTFGVEQYAYLLEPRLVGFEAYAEAVGADLAGLDHLDVEAWQRAQDAFTTARSKIQQADTQFSEARSRGDSFFDRRAAVYENRAPRFDDGYLLHLRAANEFVRGNTENAKDLRFEGTTRIRNAFATYPITANESGTSTPE